MASVSGSVVGTDGPAQNQGDQEVQSGVEDSIEHEAQNKVEQQVVDKVEQEVQDKVEQEVPDKVEQEVTDKAEKEVQDKVEQEAENKVGPDGQDTVGHEVENEAGPKVPGQVEHEVEHEAEHKGGSEVVEIEIEDEVKDQAEDEREKEVGPEVQDKLKPQVEDKVEHESKNEAGPEVIDKVIPEVVEDKVEPEVEDKVGPEVEDKPRHETENKVQNDVEDQGDHVAENKVGPEVIQTEDEFEVISDQDPQHDPEISSSTSAFPLSTNVDDETQTIATDLEMVCFDEELSLQQRKRKDILSRQRAAMKSKTDKWRKAKLKRNLGEVQIIGGVVRKPQRQDEDDVVTPTIQNTVSMAPSIPNRKAPINILNKGPAVRHMLANQISSSNSKGSENSPPPQVLNMSQIIYDSNSGLLLVPTGSINNMIRPGTSIGVSSLQSGTTNTITSSTGQRFQLKHVSSGVTNTIRLSGAFRGIAPTAIVTTTTTLTSNMTPRIVGTTSLSTALAHRPPSLTPQQQVMAGPKRTHSGLPTAVRHQPPNVVAPSQRPTVRPLVSSTTQRVPNLTPLATQMPNKNLSNQTVSTTSQRPTGSGTVSSTVNSTRLAGPAPIRKALITAVETPAINGSTNPSDKDNNKTYPSLVVIVKPCLQGKLTKQAIAQARTDLDARVKSLLQYPPSKFTEWLMQRGLLKIDHRCEIHMTKNNEYIPLKLGMYSESGKQPFSGGYVWVSECCQDKQVSVFRGSIFESAVYPPGTMMKLIYHWSCQTTSQNVLQWVKVTSYYLKNFYTLIRSCCVAALHELCPVLGGPKKYVEVGLITLGTALNQFSNQKAIKIEILGVFDTNSKIIRMKVINTQPTLGNTPQRMTQILWPLNSWVNKDSVILVDKSIDKNLLLDMGFKSVIQSQQPLLGPKGTPASSETPTNVNVMNYLKQVIPKMFQNTLMVLSKSLIQQFLDELSWRELYGPTSAATFDTILDHLVEMTKWETGEPLITRLNKISLNPFADWSYTRGPAPTGIEMLPASIREIGNDMSEISDIPSPTGSNTSNGFGSKKSYSASKLQTPNKPATTTNGTATTAGTKRKADEMDRNELRHYLMTRNKSVNLFSFYYAELKGTPKIMADFPQNLKCPLCTKTFINSSEIMHHINCHVRYMGKATNHTICEYCLKEFPNHSSLVSHVEETHRLTRAAYACFICEERFGSSTNLILHMWETHCRSEMPYKCEICNYRNSCHYKVIDHFQQAHIGKDFVMCPLCLKTLSVKTYGCLKLVVAHVQSHTLKKGKKCPQCCLVFPTDADYRVHVREGAHMDPPLEADFESWAGVPLEEILMPVPPKVPRTKFMLSPPTKKAKHEPKKKGFNEIIANISYGTLSFAVDKHWSENKDKTIYCTECKEDITTTNHFPGYLTCSKCSFVTSCQKSMLAHYQDYHPLGKKGKSINTLTKKCTDSDKEGEISGVLKCDCGFKSKITRTFLDHMFSCGKKTARMLKS